ncbi:MAG: cytochrome c biogenesis protein DipZ [Candidatus Babeliales bacterium]|nr:cytochrome c biogenesis protein DipZ [Candidatus Babeliales bacterium]
MIILMGFSLLAGIVTVLSPCILPILPLLLSAGIDQSKNRPYGIITGLIISFSFFTLALTALVASKGISPDFLRWVAIILIIFFGLTMVSTKLSSYFEIITWKIAQLGGTLQEQSTKAGSGFLSGVILGIALGLLWTPCAGPILASITTLAATHAVSWNAILITLAYSIGAGIAMFAIMYGGSKLTGAISGYSQHIRKVFGILMILGALAIAFHGDIVLQQLAIKYFPIVTIDNNEIVKKELEKLNSKKNINFADNAHNQKAPNFIGIEQWINSNPLTIEQLKGHVVLVDFWTYSCINCVRTLPYIKKWYDFYKDKGLIIVGVHTPEFAFEKNVTNVQAAINRFGITYPVALDNNYKTWQNYNNHYWPAHYLIDQQGIVREAHFGEGAYLQTENAIRHLLNLAPITQQQKERPVAAKNITPETYLGYARAAHYHPSISLKHDQTMLYDYQGALAINQVGLKGLWRVDRESITAQSPTSSLDLNFIANKVYLVMKSDTPQLITVLLDDKPVPTKYRTTDMDVDGKIMITQARMYELLDLNDDYGNHKLTLEVPLDASLYAFTFGE